MSCDEQVTRTESRSAKMRVLFVVNTSWFFISHRLRLAVAMLKAGYEVHVATQVYSEIDRNRIIASGLALHDLRIDRVSSGLFSNFFLLLSFFKLYRKVKPNLVHQVTMKPNVLGGVAARLVRIPAVVYAVSGLGTAFASKGVFAHLRREVLQVVMKWSFGHPNSCVIFQNPDDREILRQRGIVSLDHTILIPGSGVSLIEYPAAAEPEGIVRVLLATRLLRDKGVAEYVAAAEQVRNRGLDAEFLLAGEIDDGNPTSFSREHVQRWNDSGVIRWLGFVSEMPKLLTSVHIVVLPSYYGEGVPKILIEAAAIGRAVITTDMPGCREIIKNELNGLVIPPRDVDSLRAALERLIINQRERRQFGCASTKIVATKFTIEQVIEKTLKVYQGLLKQKREVSLDS